jgi:hypothetical protein
MRDINRMLRSLAAPEELNMGYYDAYALKMKEQVGLGEDLGNLDTAR